MVTPVVKELHESPKESHCVHHWLIETPDGPVSKGVCKYCGVVRYFDNTLQDKYSAESTPREMMGPEFTGEKKEEDKEGDDDEEEY